MVGEWREGWNMIFDALCHIFKELYKNSQKIVNNSYNS